MTDSSNVRITSLDGQFQKAAAPVAPLLKTRLNGGAMRFVRPVDLALDGQGNMVVLDAGRSAVIVLSPGGTVMREFGHAGAGPGEFGLGLSRLLVGPNDTVYVPNPASRKLEVFSPDGKYIGTRYMAFGSGLTVGFAIVGPGDVYRGAITLATDPTGQGLFEPRVNVYKLTADTMDVAATFTTGTKPQTGLYSAFPQWAASTDRIAVTSMDVFEVRFYDNSLKLRDIWRGSQPAIPISEADQATLLDQAFNKLPPTVREGTVAAVRRLGFATHYPPAAGLLIADDGSVWLNVAANAEDVRRGRVPNFTFDNVGSPVWRVFSSDGIHIRDVTLPPQYHLKQVRAQTLYGISEDAEGNPIIEVLTLPTR